MPKAAKRSTRTTTFATLDLAETCNVVWVLDRERGAVRRILKRSDQADQEAIQPLLDALDSLHDRLAKRLSAHRAGLGISSNAG